MDAADRPPETTALYVGDLDPSVTDDDLMKAFTIHAQTPASVRISRRSSTTTTTTGPSLCHAFVNFHSKDQAMEALRDLNHAPLRGRPMRVMVSQREAIKGKVEAANVFVKNLDEAVDGKVLEEMFGVYGQVVSCKVAMENERSKGFGFVQFGTEEEAQAAITALHGSLTTGQKKLYVAKFINKSERTAPLQESKSSNLYVKNFGPEFTDDLLRETFSAFGKVQSAVVMKDAAGKPKGFGFVNFKLPEDANKAMKAMNGMKLGSKNVYVGVAQKKDERKKLLSSQFQEKKRLVTVVVQCSSILVAELDRSFDDKKLEEYFAVYGKVQSAKVMCDQNGMSKGFGIIRFSSSEEASKAIAICHGNGVAVQSEKKHTNPLQLSSANKSSCAVDGHSEFLIPRSLINYQPFYLQQQHGVNPFEFQQTLVQSNRNHLHVDCRVNFPLLPTSVYHAPVIPQMHHLATRTNYIHGNTNSKMLEVNNQYWEPYSENSEAPHFNRGNVMEKYSYKYCEKPREASKEQLQTIKPQAYVRKIKFNDGEKRKDRL